MDKFEMQQWLRETAKSKQHWLLDEVTLQNQQAYLFYQGGESGYWARIQDGIIQVGTYTGAIPHIGEALFIAGYSTHQYKSNSLALTRFTEVMGRSFLLDMLGLRCFQSDVPEWLRKVSNGDDDRTAARNAKYAR